MVQYSRNRLDDTFSALSDATRRAVLLQLGRGNASITELAEQFHMSLTGINKHVGILEQTGLVRTEKIGRVRTCMLGSCRLDSETVWIDKYKETWDRRFDALEIVVQELKQRKENK
jgi:DNA-binding transcriptional ArsR family regulator